MNPKAARRPVRALSVQEKLLAIDRVHDGESKAAVARDIGVPESTLRGWCKGEEKLRNVVARQGSNSPLSGRTPPPPLPPPTYDAPLDFSRERTTSPTPATPPTTFPTTHDSLTYPSPVGLKQDNLLFWLQQHQSTLPISPQDAHTAAKISDNTGWFWKWYKSTNGIFPQMSSVPHRDTTQLSDEEDEPPATAADAVHHGERFLRWLECCSDPSVTTLQILQFRYLLNNVKECAERRRQGRIEKIRRRK